MAMVEMPMVPGLLPGANTDAAKHLSQVFNGPATSQLSKLEQLAEDPSLGGNLGSFAVTLGQAAQAHMTEAARLQAMVTAIQTQGLFAGQSPTRKTVPVTAYAAPGSSATQKGIQRPSGADASGYSGSGFGIFRGHDKERESPISAASRQARSSTASAGVVGQRSKIASTMPSMVDAPASVQTAGRLSSMASDDSKDTFQPSEPAQIKLESLRSLSSHSLPIEPDEPSSPVRSPVATGPLGVSRPAVQHEAYGDTSPGSAPWASVTVKNTFLDFPTEECTQPPLRAVQTFAGRLDFLEGPE